MVYVEVVIVMHSIHTISLYHPGPNRWVDESPINQWLLANVGMCADPDWDEPVSSAKPWAVEHYPNRLAYHFYREKDAMWFALRWS